MNKLWLEYAKAHGISQRCEAETKGGKRCNNWVKNGAYCSKHNKKNEQLDTKKNQAS